MYRSILVPLDGSPFAEQALPLAAQIANLARASLEVMRVHTLFEAQTETNYWVPYFDPVQDAEFKAREQAYLDAIVNRLQQSATAPVTSALVDCAIVDGILERTQSSAADLIVTTTHGRGLLSRFFLGSVADELLRRATMPILLVRPAGESAESKRDLNLRRILIPFDGSERAERILGSAIALGNLMNAEYLLVRGVIPGVLPAGYLDRGSVFDLLPDHAPAEMKWHSPTKSLLAKQVAEAEAYLDCLATRFRANALRVERQVVVCDTAASAVLHVANSAHVDLIAIATHGRGGVKRMLLGSVADKVIRGSVAPVLVYRPMNCE